MIVMTRQTNTHKYVSLSIYMFFTSEDDRQRIVDTQNINNHNRDRIWMQQQYEYIHDILLFGGGGWIPHMTFLLSPEGVPVIFQQIHLCHHEADWSCCCGFINQTVCPVFIGIRWNKVLLLPLANTWFQLVRCQYHFIAVPCTWLILSYFYVIQDRFPFNV